MVPCMLLDKDLPKFLWSCAVMTAAYTRNRCFHKRLGMIPVEAFTDVRPSLNNMHLFGSKCFSDVHQKKLDPRSVPGIFVGYDKACPAYLV